MPETIKSGTVKSGTVKSGTVKSGTVKSGTIKSGTGKTCRIGVIALGRPTFDVAHAQAVVARAFAALDGLAAARTGSGADRVALDMTGPREVLFDSAAFAAALPALQAGRLDLLLVLQATFTDASMTVTLARQIDAPLVLWGFPEARRGGRLRLNALCGINLAMHALGRIGQRAACLYGDTDDPAMLRRLAALAAGFEPVRPPPVRRPVKPDPEARRAAMVVRERLGAMHIGRIGAHPDGFDTCMFDPALLARKTGVAVRPYDLPDLFDRARAVPDHELADIRRRVTRDLGSLDDLEQEPLEKSLRLYAGLRAIVQKDGLDGLAVRCWPETFTDYGCAACGPMAMLNGERIPSACEADVHGSITTLMLQAFSGQPAIIADLVDMDPASDTGVLWHCGLAPVSMADPADPPRPDIHSNRKKPLLHAFALRPGRITVARLSQAGGKLALVVGGAEMLRAPRSFSGTSGVVRFDRPVPEVLDRVMADGLEHHYGFTYGDVRAGMTALGDILDIPVRALT